MSSTSLKIAKTCYDNVLVIHITSQKRTITFYFLVEWLLKQTSAEAIYNITHHFHKLHVIC